MDINMSARDLNATYRGTWLGLRKTDGSIYPIFINDCEEHNKLRYEMAGSRASIDINHPTLVLEFPDSGAYQVSADHAVYAERRSIRQWHRGLRSEGMTIVPRGTRVGFDMAKAMFNPTYPEITTVLERIKATSGWTGIALSKNFWLRNERGAKFPVIWFRNRPVGEVRDDNELHVPNAKIKVLLEEIIHV